MNVLNNNQNMDDLAKLAVGLGRQVADLAKALQLGDNAKDVAFVSRCFARLRDRQPFDVADGGGLAAVVDILERSLASQYLGTEVRYEETGYDDFGPRGETREVAVYSDRGNELIKLQCLFEEFLNVRDSVLDQVAAHRCLVGIMSA
ncbi:hypothetical protein GGR95_002248 [Sulfitobacter undariae]|uniref:Uncharacterized protein n=1 Tax=Sulfitobacter undariae TaxID=1563671 RepID=A0A7W6E8M2_9RHOB|nr:hypothetical protein [Sulfitobacter undariae]MBB3994602.1 hypothetical protein [Sulfitobacter undariae]